MNDDDPMRGSEEKRTQYMDQINQMIQQDIEQRRAQRMDEFLRTRESQAVLQGATGVSSSIIQSVDQ